MASHRPASRIFASAAFISAIGLLGAIFAPAMARAADLPERAPGLWKLSRTVVDDSRPQPKVLQCSDAETDAALAENAFLAEYLGCSEMTSRAEGDGWIIEATCDTDAGPAETVARLTGDFSTGYEVSQTSRFPDLGISVTQTTKAAYLGDCEADLSPGQIFIGGAAFSLPIAP